MIAEQSRLLNSELRADITPALSGTAVDVAIHERTAPKGSRPLAAAGILFLNSGDALVSYTGDPNGREPQMHPPDSLGNADRGMTALLYTAATLPNPHTPDGTSVNLRFDVAEQASPKVTENLGALGVDFGNFPEPVLDGGNQHRWAEDLPVVGAEKLAYSLDDQFVMYGDTAPVVPADLPPATVQAKI